MHLSDIPFGTNDWSTVERTEHRGETGMAYLAHSALRHCPRADDRLHAGLPGRSLCIKGHILFCLEGELHTELEDGRHFTLRPGMSYRVADNAEPHRSSTATGAVLFVVD